VSAIQEGRTWTVSDAADASAKRSLLQVGTAALASGRLASVGVECWWWLWPADGDSRVRNHPAL
jgi:hypothetical protein